MKRTLSGRALNWRPRLPHHACAKLERMAEKGYLPSEIDLRPNDTPIFNQYFEGSCTMNAGCSLFDYLYRKKSGKVIVTSRNFGYWVERAFDGDTWADAGSSLSTCAEVFNKKGVCLEDTWPYSPETFRPEPPPPAWAEATRYKAPIVLSVEQSLIGMKECIYNGLPFIFGMSVYQSFESAPSGVIPMPASDELLLGGHALCAVGYNDAKRSFIVRNSWGESWGDKGYCHIPYDYLASPYLASDFWTFNLGVKNATDQEVQLQTKSVPDAGRVNRAGVRKRPSPVRRKAARRS